MNKIARILYISSVITKEEFYRNNNIDEDEISWLGSGDFGDAYDIGNGKALKTTKSKKEFDIAKQLINQDSKFDGFVNYYIAEKIEEVIKSADVEKVAIEEIYVAKNMRVALKIGQVIGIIEAIAIKNNFDFETIPPREVKKCLTGIGSADKGQVKFMVETMTGYKNFKKLDESDAVAVAISSFYLREENALLHKGKDS